MTTHTNKVLRILSLTGLFVLSLTGLRAESQALAASAAPAAGVSEYPSVKDIIGAGSEDRVGKTVTFEGFVTGVCRNSGRKAFIHDRNRDVAATLRVDSPAGKPVFEQDSVGKTLRVTGTLRELRIDAAYLDSWEARIKGVKAPESAKANTTRDHCTEACSDTEGSKATLQRIASLRAKLAKQPRAYLSSFWVDGISWAPLNAN